MVKVRNHRVKSSDCAQGSGKWCDFNIKPLRKEENFLDKFTVSWYNSVNNFKEVKR